MADDMDNFPDKINTYMDRFPSESDSSPEFGQVTGVAVSKRGATDLTKPSRKKKRKVKPERQRGLEDRERPAIPGAKLTARQRSSRVAPMPPPDVDVQPSGSGPFPFRTFPPKSPRKEFVKKEESPDSSTVEILTPYRAAKLGIKLELPKIPSETVVLRPVKTRSQEAAEVKSKIEVGKVCDPPPTLSRIPPHFMDDNDDRIDPVKAACYTLPDRSKYHDLYWYTSESEDDIPTAPVQPKKPPSDVIITRPTKGILNLPAFKLRQQEGRMEDDQDPDKQSNKPPSKRSSGSGSLKRKSIFAVVMDKLHRESVCPSVVQLRSTVTGTTIMDESATGGDGSSDDSTPKELPPDDIVHVEFSAMALFLKDWRNQELSELVVVPDPYDLTELVIKLTWHGGALNFCVMFGAVCIFTLFWYAQWQIPLTFATEVTREILWPGTRYWGTVLDFLLVPFLIANWNVCLLNWPKPEEWTWKKIGPGSHRYLRWGIYYAMVIYLFVMNWFWVAWVSKMPSRLTATMERNRLSYPHSFESRELWNATSTYFFCCGREKYTEWEDKRISNNILVMHHVYDEDERTELFFYPMECCDLGRHACIDYPQIYELMTQGCYDPCYALAMTTMICCLLINFAVVGCAVAASFFMYVMETVYITAPDVPERKSSIDWGNTKEAQEEAAKNPYVKSPYDD